MYSRTSSRASTLLGPALPKKVTLPLYSVAEGREWK